MTKREFMEGIDILEDRGFKYRRLDLKFMFEDNISEWDPPLLRLEWIRACEKVNKPDDALKPDVHHILNAAKDEINK